MKTAVLPTRCRHRCLPYELLLSINSPEDWQTSERYVWHSRNKPENFRFYARDDVRYMETQLAGRQRHWAIAAIPRDELVITRQGEKRRLGCSA